MSVIAIKDVLKLKVGSSSKKAVLFCLAFHLNEKTNKCYPSTETIINETELSHVTVFKALKELKNLGLIEVVGKGPSGVNFYSLNLNSLHECVA